MLPIQVTEQQIDQIVKTAYEIMNAVDIISPESFHVEMKNRLPDIAQIDPSQVEYVLAAYYEFSAEEVVKKDIGDYDNAITTILS